MTDTIDPLILTFAEIEFVLRARPAQAEAVRRRLRINPDAASDIVLAAGVSSLLARGLCTMSGTDVQPTETIIGVTGALSSSHTWTEAASWIGTRPVVMHMFTASSIRLAVFPAAYGQFTVELLSPAEPLADPIARFMDTCTAGDGEAACIVRSSSRRDHGAPAGVPGDDGDDVAIAIARDVAGGWHISDSVDSPDRSHPVTRDEVGARLAELLGARPVAAG